MLFRRIILSALVVGAVTGGLFGLAQHVSASQIIHAAETYEGGAAAETAAGGSATGDAAARGHDHGDEAGHAHDHGGAAAWEPSDGAERVAYTVLADVFVAIGFGTLLLVAMYTARRYRGAATGPARGALWGLAGFVAVFAAPALGLPPEVPGAAAAPLEQRQLWWLATALVTATGLGLIAFAPRWQKLAGLALLPMPHLFGAPQPQGPMFTHPDPAAVQALEALHTRFIVSTTLTNAIFWALLGVACGWALQRWVLPDDAART